ncbi:MAG TPA: DUF819 family protein, partial [bacterium]|nr:DUF819 family protein [bacterium]
MDNSLVASPAGVLAVLAGICSFFFWLEKRTAWKLFNFVPPLLFIYLTPVLLSNGGVIPKSSPAYDFLGSTILPFFLTVMLLEVNLLATVKAMGRGVFVMLLGTLGVVVGAPIGFALVKHGLDPGAWQGFGALAGSWIGGTGNMLAVSQMIDLDDNSVQFGYAVIADNAVYLIWLPILLGSKSFAERFHRFTRVPANRMEELEEMAERVTQDKGRPEMRHLLYLIFLGFAVTAAATAIAPLIPEYPADQPLFTTSTYRILLVTVMAIALSFTPASRIPGAHPLAMALIYLFVARMGARADLSQVNGSVLWFLLGAYVWIFVHGVFLVTAARIFRVDV